MKKLYPLLTLLLFIVFDAVSQRSITVLESAVTENFNTLASAGTTNDVATLPVGWTFLETSTNANTTYAASTGSSNAGNTYSFGTDADRALGGLQSGTLVPTIGASFVNSTGNTITSLLIQYRGEQWRLGTVNRGSDRLDFQYSLNATALNNGTWTGVESLTFIAPNTSGSLTLNGNANGNFVTLSYEITGLSIPAGAVFYFRWIDFNAASSDDGLGVDDFSLTAYGEPADEESITFNPGALVFGEVNLGETKTLSYEVNGANLTEGISISVASSDFSLSLDNNVFSNSISLPDSGGIVYARYTPSSNGSANTTIQHQSGTLVEELSVTANGYDPLLNIISIQTARTRPVGSKVTIAGRITVANEFANPAQVQDATSGIPVFFAPLASTAALGDSVIVTGPIGLFNEQKQISGSGIFFTRIDVTPLIPSPKVITVSQMAANEGLLVTINDVSLVNDAFVFYPQSTERISDATGSGDLRIDGDTNIPGLDKPSGTFSVTGVVGRFRTSPQLMPRADYDIPAATEPTNAADTISKVITFDVVTWNFEFFGATVEQYGEEYGPANEQLQLTNIKRVLDSLQADVIGVQEVSDETLFASLAQQAGYGYICSPRYSYSFNGPDNSFPPQKVCFLYDTTVVDVTLSRVLFENLYDSARTIAPNLLPNYPGGSASSFYSSGRLPFLMEADVTIQGVKEKMSFIVIHAKSGSTVEDRARRLYDGNVLKDTLDAHFWGSKFVILGDLNDDLDQSITTGYSSPYQNFTSDADYASITLALSEAGARSTVSFNDVIDHQIISASLASDHIDGSVQIIAPFRWIQNYGGTTSDHLPVISRYILTAPIANFTVSNVALSEDSVTTEIGIVLDKASTVGFTLPILVSGDALFGSDFTVSFDTISFAAGQLYSSITVTVVNDSIDELVESAVFTLASSENVEVGNDGELTVQIFDNDVPAVSFASSLSQGAEGGEPQFIAIVLSTPNASDQELTVSLSSPSYVIYGVDYTTEPAASNGQLSITVPAGSTEVGFYISPLADGRKEKLPEVITSQFGATTDGLMATSNDVSSFTIMDVKKNGKFYVYPNPVKNHLNLLNENEEQDGDVHVELISDKGVKLFSHQGKLSSVSNALNEKVRTLGRGIYYLNIVSDDEQVQLRVVKD